MRRAPVVTCLVLLAARASAEPAPDDDPKTPEPTAPAPPVDHAHHADHEHHEHHAAPASQAEPGGHGAHEHTGTTAPTIVGAVPRAHHHGAEHQAEHHGTLLGPHHRHAHGSSWTVSLGLVAATYDARLFEGDYEGMVAGVRWARGRFGAAITVPAYRLVKNGRAVDGLGDVMAHGHLTLASRGTVAFGLMLMASAPTGDGQAGLGMGHPMVMPELWAAWAARRLAVVVSAGYSRALGGEGAHAEHGGGMWPLVDPMNAEELPFGATAMAALGRGLGVGARVAGAVPLDDGDRRLYGGVRVLWTRGRVDTSAEVLGGVVGDPFGVRGVLETSVRFE